MDNIKSSSIHGVTNENEVETHHCEKNKWASQEAFTESEKKQKSEQKSTHTHTNTEKEEKTILYELLLETVDLFTLLG